MELSESCSTMNSASIVEAAREEKNESWGGRKENRAVRAWLCPGGGGGRRWQDIVLGESRGNRRIAGERPHCYVRGEARGRGHATVRGRGTKDGATPP